MKTERNVFRFFSPVFVLCTLFIFGIALSGCNDSDSDDDDSSTTETVETSTWYMDADNDGYGDADVSTEAKTQPDGYVADNTDCDDSSAAIHPGAEETCGDGIDQDCDGSDLACETSVYYKDADADGYSDGTMQEDSVQPDGYYEAGDLVATSGDCDDSNAAVNPEAAEVCDDGIDNDCNGSADCIDDTCVDDASCNDADLTYPIVDTNQGFCYDNSELLTNCPAEGEAFYGQDAQYTGNVPNYTDNWDGTVTDNVTGLVWTQNVSSYAMPWSDASSYCESLTTGGYSDWRLPSVKELWSIRDFSQGWPWVDTDYFYLVGDGSDQRQQHSWTSNRYLVESEYQNEQLIGDPSFIVNDWTGHIKAMSGNRFVRAVRGNTSYGVNDFVDNGDGTVSDNATSLMWSQDDNGEAINWEAALAYTEAATTAGYDDWRLPNAKELQSIADYSGVFPAINTSVFNLTKLTNIKGQTDYPFYWTSTSNPYIEAFHAEESDSGSSGSDFVPGYTYAWMLAVGYCTDMDGNDLHGSGAVVFDTKAEDVSDGSGVQVFYHYVRLVRSGDVTKTPDGDPGTVNPDRVVEFEDGDTGNAGGGDTPPGDVDIPPGDGETPPGNDPSDTPPGDEGGPDFSPGVDYLATIGITVTEEELVVIVAGPPAPSASALVANFAAYDVVITEAQAQALLDTLNLP